MSDFDDLITAGRSEHAEQNEALMRLSMLPNTLVYRQNTGTAWQGRPVNAPVGEYVRVLPGMKILADARPIDFGCPGAGDIVGQSRGRPLQVEMKTLNGRQRKTQEAFGRAWVERGGVYILARSADAAVTQVKNL